MAQRITTAFFLIAGLLLIVLGLPAIFFTLTCLMIAVIAAWEWNRIAKLPPKLSIMVYALTIVFLALAQTRFFNVMILVCVALVAYALVQVIRYEKIKHYRSNIIQLSLVGPLLIATTAAALPKLLYPELHFTDKLFATTINADIEFGRQAMLLIYALIIVGVADSGAYFVGRSLGANKLCPKVSPNKTVEGLFGGLAAVVVFALLFSGSQVSFFFGNSVVELVVTSLLIALVSVAGDLFISTIKRQNSIKDSSQLLPGHGGVLDRIDGLLLAVPVYYFFTLSISG